MNYTLAVFKSRFATLNFANLLKQNNIPAAIINTPAVLQGTCGISVKFLSDYLSRVQSMLTRVNLSNFAGLYLYSVVGGRANLIRI